MGDVVKFQAQTTFLTYQEETQKFKTWGESFEAASDERKLRMIWTVAGFETCNGIKKDELHQMLRWLAHYALEEE